MKSKALRFLMTAEVDQGPSGLLRLRIGADFGVKTVALKGAVDQDWLLQEFQRLVETSEAHLGGIFQSVCVVGPSLVS